MRTTMDGAGRLVVPKAMRDAMGLASGGKVDIMYTDGRLEIAAAPVDLELATEDGLPVLRALEDLPALTAATVRDTQESIRAERDHL